MVSIIVPIYKVEEYLSQCIDSILCQTYSDLEIILVDDGSPDNSGSICEEYAKKDKRIKVIHKENQGLGKARNSGLELATGEFVCFVDSDDWLVENAVETWISYQIIDNADMVMCNYDKRDNNNSLIYQYRIVNEAVSFNTADDVRANIFWPMIGQKSTVKNDFTVNMCVWTNLYKRNIIQDNNIKFLSEREYLSEDICFNLQYLLNCNSAVMIPESLYNYRYNPNSLTNHYKGDEFGKAKRLYAKVLFWAEMVNDLEEQEYRVDRFFITKVRELLFRLCGSANSYVEKSRICKIIVQDSTLEKVLQNYPICKYKLKYKLPALLMKMKNYRMLVLLFTIMQKKIG